MIIHIHRGQNQIGGSIVEVSSDSTRVVFDVGINLDQGDCINVPKIKGLFFGEPEFDAVMISHYHSDHIGLLNYVLEDIPVFMGKQAFSVVKAAAEYRNQDLKYRPNQFQDRESILIGDLSITPLKCDHSACDSYMFTVSDGKKTVLYTGDFRANGRMEYHDLLDRLPVVDALITEGTVLSRETYQDNILEEDLERIALSRIGNYPGTGFIMASAMNTDRMVTAYNIAHKDHRLFLEDLYTAEVLESIGFHTIEKEDIRVFMTGGDRQYEHLQNFASRKIGKKMISESRFLMCVRPSMMNYLSKLNELVSFEKGILFYSMWKGYQEKEDVRKFLDFMRDRGVKIHALHTSGHADIRTIDALIEKTSPGLIVPVHTENPLWFAKYGISIETEKEIIRL